MNNQPANLYVGIDLGTTNSVISFTNVKPNGDLVSRVFSTRRSVDVYNVVGSKTSQSTRQEPTLPSVVYYSMESGYEPIVGNFARKQYAIRSHLVARSIKSQMGLPAAQGLSPDVPDKTPAEISSRILSHMLRDMERTFRTPIKDAIITVPASFDAIMCQATREAARLAGLEVVNKDGSEKPILLSEPNAVIYDLINQIRNGEVLSSLLDVSRKKRVLVFDLGGGTLDVSLHDIEQDSESGSLFVDEIATNRYTRIGGDDFDKLLADAMYRRLYDQYQKYPEIQSLILHNKEQIYPQLMDFAENLKLEVSQSNGEMPFSGWGDFEQDEFIVGGRISTLGYSYDDSFTKEEFEEILAPLLAKDIRLDQYKTIDDIKDTNNIIYPILDVLNKAAKKSDGDVHVDAIIMNGGMSKLYLVEERLKDFFGIAPITAVDPDQSVARGAAIYHYLLSHNQITKGISAVEMLQEQGLEQKGSSSFNSDEFLPSEPHTAEHSRSTGFSIRQTTILNDTLYLQGQNNSHRKIIEAGTNLPHQSEMMTGFMIRAGQKKIAIPVETLNYAGQHQIIANSIIELKNSYNRDLFVRLQLNLSESKIMYLRAWIADDSEGNNILEEASTDISVGNRYIPAPLSVSKNEAKISKIEPENVPTRIENVEKLLNQMISRLEAVDRTRVAVIRGETEKEAVRIETRIANCANCQECAFPVITHLKNTINNRVKSRLFILARKTGDVWTEKQIQEVLKIAKLHLHNASENKLPASNLNGANIEAIYLINKLGNDEDAREIADLRISRRYRNPLLELCGRHQISFNWIYDVYAADADKVYRGENSQLNESARALGNILRLSTGKTVAMERRTEIVNELIDLLETGSLYEYEVTSVIVSLASTGDQRFNNNFISPEVINTALGTLRSIREIYGDTCAAKSAQSVEIAESLLLGQTLEADQEAYLLVMLEGEKKD